MHFNDMVTDNVKCMLHALRIMRHRMKTLPYILRYRLMHDDHTTKLNEKTNGKNLINHFELITVVVDRFTLLNDVCKCDR